MIIPHKKRLIQALFIWYNIEMNTRWVLRPIFEDNILLMLPCVMLEVLSGFAA